MRHLPAILLASILASCSQDTPTGDTGGTRPETADDIHLFTVNYPLAYFAERILAGTGAVSFPAPSDVDPAYWSPSPDVIAAYQEADLILLNGAGYAGWVASA